MRDVKQIYVKGDPQIGAHKLSHWAKVIRKAAWKEIKGTRFPLKRHKVIETLLLGALYGQTDSWCCRAAGITPGILKAWREKQSSANCVKMFIRVFDTARAQIRLLAGRNVFDAIEDGNINLSEKVLRATNTEFSEKQKVDITKRETKDVNLNIKVSSDAELNQMLIRELKKSKRIKNQNSIVELKQGSDGSFRVTAEPDRRQLGGVPGETGGGGTCQPVQRPGGETENQDLPDTVREEPAVSGEQA